ncbi:MAG: alpha-L-arabinofuranosidase C-terminal domain-containing protein [Pyrinomonadaceae bacterium]
MNIKRREFLGGLLGLGAGLVLAPKALAQTSRSGAGRIEIMLDEKIGTVSPHIYGHFVEHLGGVVYDGIWVGEKSKVRNYNGIRADLVDALKKIKPPNARYPGGCFADSYNWRDGIGPRADRPTRTNFWNNDPAMKQKADSPARFEPNSFGTNEFVKFCQLIGAEPYLAANLRGLGANDFYEWVEYCNSPAGSTTGAKLRATGELGSREPFNVKYWGVGNESWGCGGDFQPDEYLVEFRRFTSSVPSYRLPLKFIGSGANGEDYNWTRGFFSKGLEKGRWIFDRMWGWAIHHYSWNASGGRTWDWVKGKSDAVNFDNEQYYNLLQEANKMDNLLNEHWRIMGEYDRDHKTKFVVDEWGSWHTPGTEVGDNYLLSQQLTIRDALVSGLTLDTFIRHADKVAMANAAQLINCLHSLFLAYEDKFTLTPNYHVFEMHLPHMDGDSVRTEFFAEPIVYSRNGKPSTLVGLAGSASVKDKTLTLTVSNPHISEAQEAEIELRGARVTGGTARVLSGDIHAHNTFENPNAVVPRDETFDVKSPLRFTFPPASVTRLQMTLA